MANTPLNIVFFPHSINYGLAGTNRLQNIVYFLQKDKVESISNISLEDKSKLFNKNNDELFLKDYKEIYYAPSIFRFARHIFQTCWYLQKFKKKRSKNLIYFYGEIDIKNFYFLKWARILGYRIVIDIVEDLETYTKFKSFKNKVKYKSAVFFRKHLNTYANGFIVVSSHLEKKIKSNFPDTPCFFLPVTINKYLFRDDNHKGTSKSMTIFYSGSFNEKDGLPFLLRALSMLIIEGHSFTLVLSGRGSASEMEIFWQDVERLELQKAVSYRGFLSRAKYIDVLSNEADILAMTRINSAYANAGFPFKLGEFLATGKPVIASIIGDVGKYLNRSDAYLVEPENSGQITQALIEIIEDKEKAARVGLNGKLAAMKYFDHEKYAAGLKQFLSETVWVD